MDKMDDIVSIDVTDGSVILYNNKYWRAFNMSGEVVSKEFLLNAFCKSFFSVPFPAYQKRAIFHQSSRRVFRAILFSMG